MHRLCWTSHIYVFPEHNNCSSHLLFVKYALSLGNRQYSYCECFSRPPLIIFHFEYLVFDLPLSNIDSNTILQVLTTHNYRIYLQISMCASKLLYFEKSINSASHCTSILKPPLCFWETCFASLCNVWDIYIFRPFSHSVYAHIITAILFDLLLLFLVRTD